MNDMSLISVHGVSGQNRKQPVVTRALLEIGGMAAIYMQDAPGLRLLTEEERAESIASMLSTRPDGDVWVFGYGSLILESGVQDGRTTHRPRRRLASLVLHVDHRRASLSRCAGVDVGAGQRRTLSGKRLPCGRGGRHFRTDVAVEA